MLQFTQEEWAKNQYTGTYSRGAWEFRGRDYPEEWIGRRNTFEPNSTVLIAEGVHFEIIGEHEWTEESLRIPAGDVQYEGGMEGDVISAYLETWFDVDQKFGTHTHNAPEDWVNLYAILNLKENLLTMKYFVDTPTGQQEFSYIPTTMERELVIRLVREAWEQEAL